MIFEPMDLFRVEGGSRTHIVEDTETYWTTPETGSRQVQRIEALCGVEVQNAKDPNLLWGARHTGGALPVERETWPMCKRCERKLITRRKAHAQKAMEKARLQQRRTS